jgi:hypothetical protein
LTALLLLQHCSLFIVDYCCWRWLALVCCCLLCFVVLAAGGLAGLRPVAATATATQEELKARVTLVWSAGLAHGTRNGTDM